MNQGEIMREKRTRKGYSEAQQGGAFEWVSRTVRDIWNQAFGASRAAGARRGAPALQMERLERRVLLSAFTVSTSVSASNLMGDVVGLGGGPSN
jgi:hypothetical protein